MRVTRADSAEVSDLGYDQPTGSLSFRVQPDGRASRSINLGDLCSEAQNAS